MARTAFSAKYVDVNNVVNGQGTPTGGTTYTTKAAPGEVVTIPADTQTWGANQRLLITNPIILQGATTVVRGAVVGGVDSTTFTVNDQTIIKDGKTTGSPPTANLFYCTFPSTGSPVIKGITFDGSLALGGNGHLLQIDGVNHNVRVTQCHFINAQNYAFIVDGETFGVMDHCVTIQNVGSETLSTNHSTYRPGGTGNYGSGDGSWSDGPNFLTNRNWNWFYEDCKFESDSSITVSSHGLHDGQRGMRRVIRHCYLLRVKESNHGTESGGRNTRGSRSMQSYQNIVDYRTLGLAFLIQFRSGSAMIWGNTFIVDNISQYKGWTPIANRMYQYFSPWGGANGRNLLDNNDTTGTGTYVFGQAPHEFYSGTVTAINHTVTAHSETGGNTTSITFTPALLGDVEDNMPVTIGTKNGHINHAGKYSAGSNITTVVVDGIGGAVANGNIFTVGENAVCRVTPNPNWLTAGGGQWKNFWVSRGNGSTGSCALISGNTDDTLFVGAEVNAQGDPEFFTPNETIKICRLARCSLDQPGVGKCDLLGGGTPPSTPNKEWPRQNVEPMYAWLNSVSLSPTPAPTVFTAQIIFDKTTSPPPTVKPNRDYFNTNPGFAPSDGTKKLTTITTGVGYGLLTDRPHCPNIAGSPQPQNDGNVPTVAYWATDTKELYVCTGPDTWTLYYTPHIYPHELVAGGGGDTTAPTGVAITSPANGGPPLTGFVTVTASASDNVGVFGVQFLLDDVINLGIEDTTAPYSTLWSTSTATPGIHTLSARARDAANNSTTSLPITVTVTDQAGPTVSISAPADNATVSGSSVTVSATASDNVAVVGVKFRLDGTTDIGVEDMTSPYSVIWDTTTGVTNDFHTLTAVARDAAGNITTSLPITVTVSNDITAPLVNLTAPGNATTVSGSAVTVSADASDDVGVLGVTFKLDGVTTIGVEDTTAPYSVVWNSVTASNAAHTITAIARDAAGNQGTSTPAVSVTVLNPLITVVAVSSITSSSATVTWTTDAGSDSQVEYGTTIAYGTSTTLNVTSVTSHSVALSGLSTATTYHFRVKSRDASNNLAVSRDFTFSTSGDVIAPTGVAITSPAAGPVSGIIPVTATASDNVGVAGVLFQVGGVDIADDLTAAYSILWDTKTVSNASHSLVAIARDAAGNTTPSAAVVVTVNNAGPVISAVTSSGTTSSRTSITWTTDTLSNTRVDFGTTISYGTSATTPNSVTSHSLALTNLTQVTLYHYKVTSVDASGNSSSSGDFTFTTLDGTAPAVSITAPLNSAPVSGGSVTVSATATDNVAVTSVQFKLDGVTNLGTDTTFPYSISWNTIGLSNGAHYLTALASDAASNTKLSSQVNVIVANDITAPIFVSGPTVSQLTTTGATISWQTNESSDTQVEYGTTIAYGTLSPLVATLTLTHTVVLSGLTMGILYHYRVKSRDAATNLATSGDLTFTTPGSNDLIYPTVNVTNPKAASTVAGTIQVIAVADDNVGVVGVKFFLDDTIQIGTEQT